MTDCGKTNLENLDPAFDVKTARRICRDGLRSVVFGRIREEAKSGRAFLHIDRSLVSQELLEELVRLGYSVTKRPQYENDPVRIAWGEDHCPHAGKDGVVDCVESKAFGDPYEPTKFCCSDY